METTNVSSGLLGPVYTALPEIEWNGRQGFALFIVAILSLHLFNVFKESLFGVKAPMVGYRSFFEPKWLLRLRFVRGSMSIIRGGYSKYKDSMFKISRNDADILVISNKYVDELRNLPEEELSGIEAHIRNLLGSISTTHVMLETNLHTRVLQTKLTPALGLIFDDMKDELNFALETELPECKDKWVPISINHLMLRLLARVSARIFVGRANCRNEEWLSASIDYTENIFITVMTLRMMPRYLHPFVAPLLPWYWRIRSNLATAKRFIGPIIRERREAEARQGKDYQKHEDLLQWMMDGAKKEAAKRKPTFVDMDPPEHMQQRSMVEPLFTREHIDGMRPHIQQTVDSLIDEMIKGGGKPAVDIVEKLALPTASYIIYGILGVPFKDLKYLTQQAAIRSNGSATAAAASAANQELLEYIGGLVDQRIAEPRNDLISKLVVEQLKPGHLQRDDVIQMAFLMLVAGNATMVNMINLGIVTLFENPSQLADLKKDLSLVPQFVEELCRFHTASAMATRRVAKVDIELGGKTIKAGEGIIAATQSGNRDADVFPDPDTFNMHRKRGAESAFGFGYGEHRCVAEWLARAELEIVFTTLFRRLPDLKLAVPLDEVKYSDPWKDVGITELPITW